MRSAAVCIQKNAANLEEWLKWHLDVCKFSEAYVFCDDCMPPKCGSQFNGRAKFFHIARNDEQSQQFAVYNFFLDSCKRDIFSCNAAAFIDSDEYLVLHGKSIEQHLQERPPALCYSWNWTYFGSREDFNAGDFTKLASRFCHRASKMNKHVKIALNIDILRRDSSLQLVFMNPHCIHDLKRHCIAPSSDFRGNVFYGPYNETDADPSTAPYIAHFYSRTEEEFRQKIENGRPDCPKTSQFQYFNQEKHMLEERTKCDLNEVYDTELHDAL